MARPVALESASLLSALQCIVDHRGGIWRRLRCPSRHVSRLAWQSRCILRGRHAYPLAHQLQMPCSILRTMVLVAVSGRSRDDSCRGIIIVRLRCTSNAISVTDGQQFLETQLLTGESSLTSSQLDSWMPQIADLLVAAGVATAERSLPWCLRLSSVSHWSVLCVFA